MNVAQAVLHPRSGFSLVELSIVLVILGLLTGGILAGQSLIRASELRSVTTELNRYITATNSFRDKYFQLPGDMNNASKFWGAQDGTTGSTVACYGTASTSALTCNGNNDGTVLPSTGSNESFRYWQHLANAGLIEGSYDGIEHGTTSWSSTAANSPRGKLTGSMWFMWNWASFTGNGGVFDGILFNNFLSIGGGPVTNTHPVNGIMKPEEMWNIDTKIDDGKPGYGKVIPYSWPTCTTATLSSQVNADYLLTSSSNGCVFIYRQVF